MRLRPVLCAACWAALLLSASLPAGARGGNHHRVGLILHDNILMRTRASNHASVLAVLVQQTQVEVMRTTGSWSYVRIWASVKGWVPRREIVFRKPWVTVSTYRAPEVHYHVRAHGIQPIQVAALTTAQATLRASPAGSIRARLPSGSRISVNAWQQDATNTVWYRIGRSWMRGDVVRFLSTEPGRVRIHGMPIWNGVRGKGMWLTLGTVSDNSAQALVQAALSNRITHMYVESAISPLGFHGRRSVGHLLEAAHRHHVTVIAWVYPYLYDLASDVTLTRQVASFRTPHGDRFDGIAADIERNMTMGNVRAYAQLTRAYLGTHYLLVGVTYPPQSLPDFPFAEVAHSYNVIAPMDYWHQTKSTLGLDFGHMPYGYDYGYRYAMESVQRIRAAGSTIPVAPIGQTFDNFGRLEMGPHAPSAREIRGFLDGSKASGAIGVSFFQWMTATTEEWHEIRKYRM